MSTPSTRNPWGESKQGLPAWLSAILALLVLAGGIGAAVAFVKTKPTAKKESEAAVAPAVEVATAQRGKRPVTMQLQGQVMPATRVVLMPEVGGRVVWQSPDLVPGGMLKKGVPLVRIDGRDYALMLEQQQAQLAAQQLQLKVEHGRRKVAEREWALFEKERERAGMPLSRDTPNKTAAGDAGAPEEGPLALREPFVKSAQVAVSAAKSNLSRARLQLSKTTLSAPFNAFVQMENVDTGQLVSPGYQLATLVGTDAFWVQVSIPLNRLPFIRVPRGDEQGSRAKVWIETGNGRIEREGRVIRLLGDLEVAGRMARMLVEIDDPFLLQKRAADKPKGEVVGHEAAPSQSDLPLLLGAYVRVEIEGVELKDVAEIPRRALQENDQVFVVSADDTLRIEKVDVAWGTQDTVVVTGNLADGERVVTSALAVPVQGMKLRVMDGGAPKPSAEVQREGEEPAEATQ